MDPIFIIVIVALLLVFLPISLVNVFFHKQDYDDSRVILPR
ncbi:MAG: hypothetical protein Fur0035_14240 [Anaerolineales bacterium]